MTQSEKSRQAIHTDNAPAAIGAYSQAVRAGSTVWISGQIPLSPSTMTVVDEDFVAQAHQVFQNLKAIAVAAGGRLDDAVKLNVYLTDLGNFASLNEVMGEHMSEPYPARAAIEVSALPKGVAIEIDAVLHLSD